MQNPYGEGTVGTEYSTYYLIGDDLQLADQQSFRDLRVEVTTEDGVVSVVAIGELEDGRTLRVRYEGAPTVLKNGTTGLGENVQIDAMNLLVASYYGDEQKQGTGNYFLQFVSYEADDSGKPSAKEGTSSASTCTEPSPMTTIRRSCPTACTTSLPSATRKAPATICIRGLPRSTRTAIR